VTTIAPTLLVTNTGGPFITLERDGTEITDLLFHYPNQVNTSASTPKVYPYTIGVIGNQEAILFLPQLYRTCTVVAGLLI
jgi:hypothetical protein